MMPKTLTPSECMQFFKYSNGTIYWRDRPKSHFKRHKDYKTWETKCKGKPSGKKNDSGYLITKLYIRGNYEIYRDHWIIWAMFHNEWPLDQIDHIDHNPLNNKIENLRLSNNKENKKNKGLQSNNKSGVNGVYWSNSCKCWRASIQINGKARHIGLYDDIEDAKIARMEKEKEFGFHPNHGKNLN